MRPSSPVAGSTTRAVRDLAEIALEATSDEEFARSSLEVMIKALSMDTGAINRATPHGVTVSALGLRSEPLRQSLIDYLDELTPEELRFGLSGAALVDSGIFPDRRKAGLRLYAEYLNPAAIYGFCCKGWINHHGAFWVTLSRAGRRIRYSDADLGAVEMLGSVLGVGAALHGFGVRTGQDLSICEDRCRDRRLTRAEFQVADLVARGLSNEGISIALGRSKHTVRNQLAAIFGKLRVSSRREMLLALAEPDARSLARPGRTRGTLASVLASGVG